MKKVQLFLNKHINIQQMVHALSLKTSLAPLVFELCRTYCNASCKTVGGT